MPSRRHQDTGRVLGCCSSSRKQIAAESITTIPVEKSARRRDPSSSTVITSSSDTLKSTRMSRAFRWQSIYCYYCATLLLVIFILPLLLTTDANKGICQCERLDPNKGAGGQSRETKTSSSISQSRAGQQIGGSSAAEVILVKRRPEVRAHDEPNSLLVSPEENLSLAAAAAHQDTNWMIQAKARPTIHAPSSFRFRRSPLVAPSMPATLLMPINELRVSGSKSEPPSRPSVDWSKQRPYFGPDMVRNVSVELGKTAYLTCKVFELGDKTVSWLRPRENEILTAGRFTYIGDSRFASINDNGSHDWILEIKDVGLNDSTSYECQVSTDPKMSVIINLQVKAAKAKIKQGEQYYAPTGSNIEFTCEIGQRAAAYSSLIQSPSNGVQQTYWYYNGNLLNYARAHNSVEKNFSIEWDSMTQTSRFRLFNIQPTDVGNYTCKPTSAEPATIRLFVKRHNKSSLKDRTHYGNGYHSPNTKEAQRTRQHFSLENGNGLDIMADSGEHQASSPTNWLLMVISCIASLLLTIL